MICFDLDPDEDERTRLERIEESYVGISFEVLTEEKDSCGIRTDKSFFKMKGEVKREVNLEDEIGEDLDDFATRVKLIQDDFLTAQNNALDKYREMKEKSKGKDCEVNFIVNVNRKKKPDVVPETSTLNRREIARLLGKEPEVLFGEDSD